MCIIIYFSRYIFRKNEENGTKPNSKFIGGENKELTGVTHALGGLAGWAEEQLPRAVFSPEVPSHLWSPRGRGFLTSFVLAPPRSSTCFGSWLVLPGRSRGSEYVCDGPRTVRGRGTPAPPPPRPRGCGTNACPSLAVVSRSFVAQRSAAQLMASQLRAAPRGASAWSLTRGPEARAWELLGGDGLDGHLFSICFPPPFTGPGSAGQYLNVEASLY